MNTFRLILLSALMIQPGLYAMAGSNLLTSDYTLTLGTPANGSISINNNDCTPGTLKKVTVTPANGYVVKTITVTDASGKALPVTQVSNATNEYVFAFPQSNVTVNAEFKAGVAEPVRFINGGMTLPSTWRSGNQPWTADTWTIWGASYDGTDNIIVGAPPTDALGHQWYEEGYALTNSDDDVLPNGKKIVWENHAASFRDGGNYAYFSETGAYDANGDDKNGDFYIRRIFTFNTPTVPTKLYLSCSYDDAPVEYYINGTLVYEDQKEKSWHDGCYEVELTPAQIALIHTDGTPNVLAVHTSQNWGGYHLDCGLYDPTAFIYEVTGEQTVRMLANHFITGDLMIPERMAYNGKTYTVTELEDDATNNCPYLTSVTIPSTITSLGNNVFANDESLVYVKSYFPVYQVSSEKVLVAAPLEATTFEVDDNCSRIWNNAFKFTGRLQTLTLPRSLTNIGYNAFVGCTSLREIYSYTLSVPETDGNAFEGIDKSEITVHVYASALNSYKASWGEEFHYVTMADPHPITLTVDVAEAGTLHALIEAAAAENGSTAFDVTGITVTGSLNQDDLRTLASMCTGVYALATIDLSGANIAQNYIDYGMFADKEKLTAITLPETLEYINDRAFHNCDGLTSIDIPASVKNIGDNAFSDCNNLATVTGMEGLQADDSYWVWDPFLGTAITKPVYGGEVFLYMPPTVTGEYEMPSGIKTMVAGSIRNSRLSTITLPASLTDIGDGAFADCSAMTDIYCYTTTPPICHDGVWEYGFDRSACTLHVPATAIEDYQNANEWSDFEHIVSIYSGNEVVVKDGVLMYVPAATEGVFTVPVGVTAIADDAFAGCSLITKVVMNTELTLSDKSLKGLADDVEIAACQDIFFAPTLYAVGSATTDLTIPQGCNIIHPYAFKSCTSLQTLTLQSLTVLEPQTHSLDGLSTDVAISVYQSLLDDYKQAWGVNYNFQTVDDPVMEGNVIAFTSADGMWQEAGGLWTSLNHGDESSAELTASLSVTAGQTIVLDWTVSSEECCDRLRGYWNDEQILDEGGMKSGTLSYTFQQTGEGILKFIYHKDGGVDLGDDCATISTSQTVQLGDYTLNLGNGTAMVVGTTLTGDITVPESFRILGVTYTVNGFSKSLFSGKKDVTSVTLPSAITVIPGSAFQNCTKLTSVTMGENVETIGAYAFAGSAVTSITIPDNVTSLGHRGLQECHALKSITVGSGVTEIPECWAEYCERLEEVTIGKRVTSIRYRSFRGTNIKHVYSYAKVPPSWDDSFYDGISGQAVLHTYSNSVSRYQDAEGWKNFTTIEGDLGTYPAFDLAANVSEMGTFSEALAEAMSTAGCADMTEISKLTVTGSINNEDLAYLSNSVGAYLDRLDLGEVTVENNAFEDNAIADGKFEELVLPNTLERLGGWYALNNCVNLKTLHIPSSVTYLGPDFCKGATSLELVTGGEGIVEIDDWSGMHFADCPNLKSPVILNNYFFRLPESTVGAYEVPENVTTIIADAMWNVDGLTALTLPASITTIYHNAVGYGPNLTDIYCYAIIPPTCNEAWNNLNRSACTLHVPTIAFEDYKNANEWSDFGHIVPMDTYEFTVNVTTPGTFETALATAMSDENIATTGAISKLTVNGSLNEADLNKLAAIGEANSFIDIRSAYNVVSGKLLIALATSATTFTFDNSLNTIHDYAFAGCSKLGDIYFTNNSMVPALPANAFDGIDKSKVTLHVYESYLNRLKYLWGEEFQYVTVADPDDLVVIPTGEPLYLFNVDAGLYFAAGNNYNTEASLSSVPMQVSLKTNASGDYIIKTLDSSDELFIDGDGEHCYVDRSQRELDYYWELQPNGDGTFLIRMASSNTHGNTPEKRPNLYFGRRDLAETRLLAVVNINDENAQLRWQLVSLNAIEAGYEFLPGDANGDGAVNIADAVAVAKHITGEETGNFVSSAADINKDGSITIKDAVAIVNFILFY